VVLEKSDSTTAIITLPTSSFFAHAGVIVSTGVLDKSLKRQQRCKTPQANHALQVYCPDEGYPEKIAQPWKDNNHQHLNLRLGE